MAMRISQKRRRALKPLDPIHLPEWIPTLVADDYAYSYFRLVRSLSLDQVSEYVQLQQNEFISMVLVRGLSRSPNHRRPSAIPVKFQDDVSNVRKVLVIVRDGPRRGMDAVLGKELAKWVRLGKPKTRSAKSRKLQERILDLRHKLVESGAEPHTIASKISSRLKCSQQWARKIIKKAKPS